MKVKMVPNLNEVDQSEGGINTLVRAYYKHMPAFGVKFVERDPDLMVVHAGMELNIPKGLPLVAQAHGLHWTADYQAEGWEFSTNASVIRSLRQAKEVIVPSEWVALVLRRDMHLDPHVIGHGIDLDEWGRTTTDGYILWNKNRMTDVCDPGAVNELAKRFPKRLFLTTFAKPNPTPNMRVTGVVPHGLMKQMVQRAGVYLATTKETFGIGMLEALASGVPVLAYREGGAAELIRHRETGYLAKPGNLDDLTEGLVYCLRYRDKLAEAALEVVKAYSWEKVVEKLVGVYRNTAKPEPTVAVIIPCYNLGSKLERAVVSALKQTHPVEIVIVNNNSTDETEAVGKRLADQYENVRYLNCPDQGVAYARNYGIARTAATYLVCLDADDTIDPNFVAVCVRALEDDPTLGVAYTGMLVVDKEGQEWVSNWPGEYNYDRFIDSRNQVPTCCCFRRIAWERLGGYRQRYAPDGQGAEDAEFFLRMGAIGFGGRKVTQEPYFHYRLGGRTDSPSYREPNWHDKPWVVDRKHPFASLATPVKFSHPVRQYDQPQVAVVIPCIKEHELFLIDALDSVERQTFRLWETVVVCDGFSTPTWLQKAYPFAHFVETEKRGAGHARNVAVERTRASMLLFLDADDYLEPEAIERLLEAYKRQQAIIYSDYYGHAYVDEGEARRYDRERKLISYERGLAITRGFAGDFDRARAMRQPDVVGEDHYIWNLVSSLVPKRWHNAIGGFDEKMPSWEDWDYWLRLARRGHNFVRVAQPLVNYRYFSGVRRTVGEQDFVELTNYLLNKFKVLPTGGDDGS